MKYLKILFLLFVFGCSKSIHTDNGRQYYIDKKNYPLEVTYVTWCENEKDYLYHIRNYSFGIHLKDSFPVGTKLYLTTK